MQKLVFCIMAVLAFLVLEPFLETRAHAADSSFSCEIDSQSAVSGDAVSVALSVRSLSCAAFRVSVGYDSDTLSYVKTETPGQIAKGTFEINDEKDPVIAVYVCNVENGFAPCLDGTIATFTFQVRDGVNAGKTALPVHVDEVCDFAGSRLDEDFSKTLLLPVSSERGSQDLENEGTVSKEPDVEASAETWAVDSESTAGVIQALGGKGITLVTNGLNAWSLGLFFAVCLAGGGAVIFRKRP